MSDSTYFAGRKICAYCHRKWLSPKREMPQFSDPKL